MLSQFSIQNYKSIWETVTLDMQSAEIFDAPSSGDKEAELPILQNPAGELFLPVSVIYGPNGSGKSNLLEALQTVVHLVLAPVLAVSGEEIPKGQIRPFAFEKEDTPTEFTLFFQTNEAEYRYFLQWKNGKILVERLDQKKPGEDKSSVYVLNGRNMELSFAEESRGIQNLFQILPFLADSLLHGKTLVIDNLDEGLHPLLLRKILSLYRDPKSNPKNAQLLFTAQETSILHQNILRKDEVWFTAKDEGQATVLYSLAEFKEPSKELNESYEQQYLDGEYGAVPYDYW